MESSLLRRADENMILFETSAVAPHRSIAPRGPQVAAQLATSTNEKLPYKHVTASTSYVAQKILSIGHALCLRCLFHLPAVSS